jgi:hypothetical protein
MTFFSKALVTMLFARRNDVVRKRVLSPTLPCDFAGLGVVGTD